MSSQSERLPKLPGLSATAQQSLTGAILKDRYQVGGQLGEGGMARVYSANDLLFSRPCAIKVAFGDEYTARLERELDIGAHLKVLKVPGLAEVYDRGEVSRLAMCFGVFEYLDGETLGERLRRGILSWQEALRIGETAATTLGAMHRAGVIHRDVTPSNVFLCRSGEVRVLDLGIARAKGLRHLTARGDVLGTPPYMSLEQVATPRDIDGRADIFMLGIVLVGAIGGPEALPQLPDRMTPEEWEAALRQRPPLATVVPEVPAGVVVAIEQACAVAREERYATILEFHEALGRAREIEAERERSEQRAKDDEKQRAARRRRKLVFAAVLAGAMMLSSVISYLAGRHVASDTLSRAPATTSPPTLSPGAPHASGTAGGSGGTRAAASGGQGASTATLASHTDHPAAQDEGQTNKPNESNVSSEHPPQEKDMTKVKALAAGAVMNVLSPNPTTHAKPPEQCQVDSDCKKKEACKSAGSLGNWCAEFDPTHCADKYRFTKRTPDRLKGKCWVESLPDGRDTASAY